MDRKRKTCDGYLTLEATFLMPLIFGGIVFTIYLSFFLYNACLIQQAAYTAALRGSLIREGSNGQIQEAVREELRELLESRLLATEEWEEEIRVTYTEVNVRVRARGRIPLIEIISDSIGAWTYEGEGQAKRLKPVEFIRTIRRATE